MEESFVDLDNWFMSVDPTRAQKGPVYYDPIDDQIVHLVGNSVYFAPNKIWKIAVIKNGRKRQIRSISEMKEEINRAGFEFLGEL